MGLATLLALRPLGAGVAEGEPLALVHAATEEGWQAAAATLRAAIAIEDNPPAERPLVLDRVDVSDNDL